MYLALVIRDVYPVRGVPPFGLAGSRPSFAAANRRSGLSGRRLDA